ncbi:hypothetical protein TI39_contig455g00013 [Zymoseptoria brevis]|uniref:Uncharacterized protein n=1 Tax=Zymoseptoria brevis TaxID=1047168 RepID=A0A0F4GKA9_9PEZI|nr:hypothetical protein TI39_contig455g00013 [Zymoseptoria brevis]
MVATRHSLPARNTDDDPIDNLDSRELKRLHIDGKETLKGEKQSNAQQRQASGTYTWRGAVYVITPDTPQEWIDNDPTRPNKREKMRKSKSREPEEEGRRRNTMGDVVAQEDEIAVPRTRKRSSIVEAEEDERPAKRTRKSMPNLSTSTRTGIRTSMAPPARPRQPRSNRNTIMEDAREDGEAPILGAADIIAGKQTVKVIAARKREAKKSGLNVTKLPPRGEICGRMIATSVVKLSKINSRIAALRADYERLKGRGAFDMLLDKVRTKRQLGEQLQSQEEAVDEDNDEDIEAAMTALETTRACQLLAGIDVEGLPSSPGQPHSSPDPIALRQSPTIPESPPEQTSSNADLATIPTPTSENNPPTQPTPPTSEEENYNNTTAVPDPDNLTPGPAASTAPSSPATVITTHKPNPAPPPTHPSSIQRTFTRPTVPATVQPPLLSLPSLPEVNRGGQKLRWTPQLSEKIQDGERAEGAIHMKRLVGESSSQKRRRVKRELREVARWQVMSEADAAQFGGGKRVDEKQDVVAQREAEGSGWTIIRDPAVNAEDEIQDGEEAYEHHDDQHDDQEGHDETENKRAGERAAQKMMEKHRAGSRKITGHAGVGGASGKRRSQPLY